MWLSPGSGWGPATQLPPFWLSSANIVSACLREPAQCSPVDHGTGSALLYSWHLKAGTITITSAGIHPQQLGAKCGSDTRVGSWSACLGPRLGPLCTKNGSEQTLVGTLPPPSGSAFGVLEKEPEQTLHRLFWREASILPAQDHFPFLPH